MDTMLLPEGGRMGKKEHPLVWYYNKNMHFAELLNGWLFHGEEQIRSEDVMEMDRRLLAGGGKKRYRERYRDILKHVDGLGIRLIVGIEEQEHVHYAMPLRVMDYETMSYLKQKSDISDRHKEVGDLEDTDELLSGFSRTDKLLPVITLVLYCGAEKAWDGAQSLHDILDFAAVSENLKEYVADYPIRVLDVCHTSDERLREFPPDIRVMFLFLKNRNDPEALEKELANEEAVGVDTYDAISDYVGAPELKKVKRKAKKGEKVNMCYAIKELVASGEKRGYDRGVTCERKNTEREKKNAEREKNRADKAEQRVRELERLLMSMSS